MLNTTIRAKLYPKLYPFYKLYMKLIGVPMHLPYYREGQDASDLIKNELLSDKPSMICRFGSLELQVIVAYLNKTENNNIIQKLSYLMKGEPLSFNTTLKYRFRHLAGFFPAEDLYMEQFAEMMINESKRIDLVGVWRTEQAKIAHFFKQAKNIPFNTLEPYRFKYPWTKALENKKVLVIHPFTESIKKQYMKRELLFENQDILPNFELKTLKAVQSAANSKVDYKTWFDALNFMYKEIDKIDFDIALIAAGAYGFPLASYIKNKNKKAVHVGGTLQLLFGIKGTRWDNDSFYENLYNEHWIRPSKMETPKESHKIEGNTYW